MTDTQPSSMSPVPGESKDKNDKALVRTVGKILLIAIIVIAVILVWRGCEARRNQNGVAGGNPFVGTVEGLEEVDGAVALWLKNDVSIAEILERNDLGGKPFTSFGEGTFIVSIGAENEKDIVFRLKRDPGVNDAGFVYLEEQP